MRYFRILTYSTRGCTCKESIFSAWAEVMKLKNRQCGRGGGGGVAKGDPLRAAKSQSSSHLAAPVSLRMSRIIHLNLFWMHMAFLWSNHNHHQIAEAKRWIYLAKWKLYFIIFPLVLFCCCLYILYVYCRFI